MVPPGIAGTVGQYAHLVGHDTMEVRGYGLVVGLGKAGSAEVPPTLRKYLTEQMLVWKVHSHRAGTGALTPARMLADLDTAVVTVRGRIPAAAPKGTRFDLYVEALPGTQTLSLDGGVLMGTELRLTLDGSFSAARKTKAWAVARGAIFVNPLIDRSKPEGRAKLRAGRIPNGGQVSRHRPVRLELRRADYRMANLIQERVNQRFGGPEARVARAKTSTVVDLEIPPSRRRDYEHFLRLVTHVHVLGGTGGQEKYARQLARAAELPTARYEDISLVWEAMGRQVLAFSSPRRGIRLGGSMAVEPMIYLAERADTASQVPAIKELGRARRFVEGVGVLKRLLASPNHVVRLAAYEALSLRGTTNAIQREDISRQFLLDVVQTTGDYAVYATSTGQPKVVLFGRNIPIRRPVFYCAPDDLVTLNAIKPTDQVSVERKIPRTGKMSEVFRIPPQTDELVRVLGKLPQRGPDGKIEGLGLTYSQV
ncbi:MAG: flagellar basal body P-ring protein FlgI, partial [Planctomycetota bacterium]